MDELALSGFFYFVSQKNKSLNRFMIKIKYYLILVLKKNQALLI
ncbi:hypothetical protein SAMN05443633_104432 [Chryseobacterium arachidis]|uniref:Uncharacterized protein n=1 Tax=Chryseobacterium arachidis TaxID=1416778 RepID=A0A1M5C784_9FLAO|nr:hypothetical protein SAMN05443633_104432 [Chryseobacterium arachidis]